MSREWIYILCAKEEPDKIIFRFVWKNVQKEGNFEIEYFIYVLQFKMLTF